MVDGAERPQAARVAVVRKMPKDGDQIGVNFHFTGEELAAHFGARAQHHRDRFEFYGAELKRAKAAGEKEPDEEEGEQSKTYLATRPNPLVAFRSRKQAHEKAARRFALMADHVVPGTVYLLGDHDLDRYEFLE